MRIQVQNQYFFTRSVLVSSIFSCVTSLLFLALCCQLPFGVAQEEALTGSKDVLLFWRTLWTGFSPGGKIYKILLLQPGSCSILSSFQALTWQELFCCQPQFPEPCLVVLLYKTFVSNPWVKMSLKCPNFQFAFHFMLEHDRIEQVEELGIQ